MGTLGNGLVETYAADIARIEATAPDVAQEVAGFTGVAQVVDWLTRRGSAVLDMVAMDEFEYDFLVEIEPGGRWLAFGVT